MRCYNGAEPALSVAERDYVRRLKNLVKEIERPGGLSRLHELSSQLHHTMGSMTQLDALPSASRIHLEQLQQCLARQQEAVRTLINVSQDDLKDLGIAHDIAKGS